MVPLQAIFGIPSKKEGLHNTIKKTAPVSEKEDRCSFILKG